MIERPTEPPPEGVALLRNEKNEFGWTGIGLVGGRYQRRWRDMELNKTRALPGLYNTPEQAAAELYEWLEAGANWDEPEPKQRTYQRNTKPPPKKRAKEAEDASAPSAETEPPRFACGKPATVKNKTMANFLAMGCRRAADVAGPSSAPVTPLESDALLAFLAMDGSGEVMASPAPFAMPIEPLD